MSLKVSFEVNLKSADNNHRKVLSRTADFPYLLTVLDNNHRKVLSIAADFPYLLTVLKVLKWLET